MIARGTRILIEEIPLSWIVVTEHQARYPERALHYYSLLSDPANADAFAGLVTLAPCGANLAGGYPLYTLLDGHHRYVGSILAGRSTVLAAIHYPPDAPEEPEEPEAESAAEPEVTPR